MHTYTHSAYNPSKHAQARKLVNKTIRAQKRQQASGKRLVTAGTFLCIFAVSGLLMLFFNPYGGSENGGMGDIDVPVLATSQENNSSNQSSEEAASNGATYDFPTRSEILAYTTAPNMPKRIEIDSASVFARVGVVHDNAQGEVGVPANIYDAAWYSGSSLLLDRPGSSVIVGHSGVNGYPAVFNSLDRVQLGDTIRVVMGDDHVLTYRVYANKSIGLKNLRMSDYIGYHGKTKSQLHLITCSGSVRIDRTYDSRRVVSAERVF